MAKRHVRITPKPAPARAATADMAPAEIRHRLRTDRVFRAEVERRRADGIATKPERLALLQVRTPAIDPHLITKENTP